MDTYVTQQVYGSNVAVDAVNSRLAELEQMLSFYVKGSDVDLINQNAGISPVKVDPLTYKLIESAKEYSKQSNGKFDITVAPLTELWKINGENMVIPTDMQINLAVQKIDYTKILLENGTVMLADKGMAIDLGGVAKGYICGEIGDLYKQHNVSSALVSIGGNVYTIGKKPNSKPYVIGIRDPKGTANNYVATLKVTDKVIATTGAYERFFEKDGVIYNHIMDTSTGFPVESDLASVAIISEDGGLADYLSTAHYIAGVAGLNLENADYMTIAIDKNNKIYISEKLKYNFAITNPEYELYEEK